MKLNFIKWQVNIIFKNLIQTLTCTNHTFIQQIYIEKNYKTSKHTNKLYTLHKNAKNLT
jgi:hypothetical protein